MRPLSDVDLLRELEPTVAGNLNRHLAVAQEWLPHEWVPWSRGRDFTGDGGLAWTPEQSRVPEAVRAAFEVNLLTEDNLPFYHHELAARFGATGAWGTWVNRWTAEEARHATGIRDYLILSRAVDPVALERDRMVTMQTGWTPESNDRWPEAASTPGNSPAVGEERAAQGTARKGALRSLVYVTFQELATRIAHRNTGRLAGDPVADRLLTRIATDENLHMIFYRDLVAAALDLAPDQTLQAIAAEVVGFRMPGTGVPGFRRKSLQIANAGIYDVRLHRDEVVQPLIRHWQALDVTLTTDAGKRAQEALAGHLSDLDQMARRHEARLELRRAAAPSSSRDSSPS
jgi:acyl-[acyl-carrier-protein] desaturase